MSPAGALAGLARDPRRSALLSDFDGTLAGIVDDPALARPLTEAAPTLARLARAMGLVGVVSGRPARFLVEHLGPAAADGVRLAGLYGLEVAAGDGTISVRPEASAWVGEVEAATAAARAAAPEGLGVEAKGLTLALHWRRAPGTARWAMSFATERAAASGLVARPGRMSVELAPPLEVDKGTVVTDWCSGMVAAGFVGDDLGDLAAFAALDRLAAEQATVVVKVAVGSDEMAPELGAAADAVVDGPEGALALMAGLAEHIRGEW